MTDHNKMFQAVKEVLIIKVETQEAQPTEVQSASLRKSSKGTQPLKWMKDFVSLNIHQDVPYNMLDIRSCQANIKLPSPSCQASIKFYMQKKRTVEDHRWRYKLSSPIE